MRHFDLSIVRTQGTRLTLVALCLAAFFAFSGSAQAQGIGFQGGATIDPNQMFVGTHFESGEIMPQFRFRPGIDGGFGNGFSLATINIEFLYSIRLKNGWALYQGGGPAIVLLRQTVGSSTIAGPP